jgi:hypothetical protein
VASDQPDHDPKTTPLGGAEMNQTAEPISIDHKNHTRRTPWSDLIDLYHKVDKFFTYRGGRHLPLVTTLIAFVALTIGIEYHAVWHDITAVAGNVFDFGMWSTGFFWNAPLFLGKVAVICGSLGAACFMTIGVAKHFNSTAEQRQRISRQMDFVIMAVVTSLLFMSGSYHFLANRLPEAASPTIMSMVFVAMAVPLMVFYIVYDAWKLSRLSSPRSP